MYIYMLLYILMHVSYIVILLPATTVNYKLILLDLFKVILILVLSGSINEFRNKLWNI
jgi:hypothetical protein